MDSEFIEKKVHYVLQTSLFVKLAELGYRGLHKKRSKRMQQAMARFHQCDCKKSDKQIKQEVNMLQTYWECFPHHYFRYDLYRDDNEKSKEELLDYIPEFFFYYLYLPYHDTKQYAILLRDKNITELLFKGLFIHQPQTLGKIVNNKLYTSGLESYRYQAIEQEIEENGFKKLFIKPIDGQGGFGIYIFNRFGERDYRSQANGLKFNKEFIDTIGKDNDYIIQNGIVQDHELTQIYPHSVNTFRVATENINGRARVICATLRLGRSGKEVDNSAQDGIIVKVDIDNGALGDYATTEQCDRFDAHPDSGFAFKDQVISAWADVKEFAETSACKLPQFTYLGWDIALTAQGPLALEANLKFGLDHYQVALGGLRKALKIETPDYYWRHKGKRV